MRWYDAHAYELVQIGTDDTRNPICELRPMDRVVLVRTAPVAPRHDANEGNRFDAIERTFLTKARKALLDGVAAIEVGGILYEVEGVAEWGDAIAIRAKRCKP